MVYYYAFLIKLELAPTHKDKLYEKDTSVDTLQNALYVYLLQLY